MRIAFLVTSMGVGGAERQAIQLAERLAQHQHEVQIFSLLGRQPHQWDAGVPVRYLNLGKGLLSLPSAWVRAARELRHFGPDILHSHCFHGNMFARLLRPALPGVRVISTVHNIFEGGAARMLLYRLTDPLSHATVFVCRAGADRYVKHRAVSRSRAEILPNGVDTSQFVKNRDRRIRTRTVLAAGSDFVWLALGRLAPAKDYPTLLRAFAVVSSAWPGAQLWIAGQGTPEAQARLQALATELGIEDRIRLLGLRRDTAALLDAADAFVLSSAWEGMPLALAEAMAMEKPIVATDAGGVPELAGPRICTVAVSQPAQLTSAMFETMRMPPALLEHAGRAARQRIVQSFSLDMAVDRWEALYASRVGADVQQSVLVS